MENEIARAREAYLEEVKKPSSVWNMFQCWRLERKLLRLLDEASHTPPGA